jgi:carbon storage regulator
MKVNSQLPLRIGPKHGSNSALREEGRMFVLSRAVGESIIIGDNIRITLIAIQGDEVQLGITAPEPTVMDQADSQDKRHIFPNDEADP